MDEFDRFLEEKCVRLDNYKEFEKLFIKEITRQAVLNLWIKPKSKGRNKKWKIIKKNKKNLKN